MFFVVFAIDFTRFHGASKMSTTGLCIKAWQSCHQQLTKVDKVGKSEWKANQITNINQKQKRHIKLKNDSNLQQIGGYTIVNWWATGSFQGFIVPAWFTIREWRPSLNIANPRLDALCKATLGPCVVIIRWLRHAKSSWMSLWYNFFEVKTVMI